MRGLKDKKEETTIFKHGKMTSSLFLPEMVEYLKDVCALAFKNRADLTLVSLAESNIYRMLNVLPKRTANATYGRGS